MKKLAADQIEVSVATWTTAPEDQGQAVVVSYGVDWESGLIFRKTTDRASGDVSYEKASTDALRGPFEPWNGRPKVATDAWRSV